MRWQPRMSLVRRLLILSTALGLSGCGFHPVYSSRGSQGSVAQSEMRTIYVEIIPDRPGQLLREALQQRLEGTEESPARRYSLVVSFGIAGDAIGVQRDTTPNRLRESATATWTLKKLDPAGALVTNGVARALDGVNILDQQYFAADLEGEYAQRRLADNVADQITLQLASYFVRHRPTPAAS